MADKRPRRLRADTDRAPQWAAGYRVETMEMCEC